MKNRIITILLACLSIMTLVSCESTETETITLTGSESQEQQVFEIDSSSNILVYKTDEVEQYLNFLEVLDGRDYEILGITTSMYTGVYTNGDFYMVTYKKLDEPREVKSTGKVSLFKTKNEEEYLSFLLNFDKDTYEILGITTNMYTGVYTSSDFYMVTYREK